MVVVWNAAHRSRQFIVGDAFDIDGSPIVRVIPPSGLRLPMSVDFNLLSEAFDFCEASNAQVVNLLDRRASKNLNWYFEARYRASGRVAQHASFADFEDCVAAVKECHARGLVLS